MPGWKHTIVRRSGIESFFPVQVAAWLETIGPDEEFVELEPQTQVDILVATPGRLMDHINMTKGFSLEHLQYLVSLTSSLTFRYSLNC
jgi:superfamily II DNA/RNA helicase